MDVFFPHATIAHLVSGLGFVLTTWLAAFLVAHRPRSMPSRLAILTLFALAGYFLHAVLCVFVPADQIGHIWRRNLGWLALWPLPLWFHLTLTLLPPEIRARQRTALWFIYGITFLLSVTWILGPWRFSRQTLLPPELVWQISLFALTVGAATIYNIIQLWQRSTAKTLASRYLLLGSIAVVLTGWILYWPVTVDLLNLPLTPPNRLALGEAIALSAAAILAYAVAYHNLFMSWRWSKRDFFLRGAILIASAGVYLLAILGARALSLTLGLDSATLTLIVIIGLTILMHFLAEPFREWSERLFVKRLRTLPTQINDLARDLHSDDGRLDTQMLTLVHRLQELSGASIVCVALWEQERLVIRASTEMARIGATVPLTPSEDGTVPKIGQGTAVGKAGENGTFGWDCLALGEPIRFDEHVLGFLLLGERGAGEGYDRQERVWVATLAAYLGAALEQARRRQEAAQRIVELSAEADALVTQEVSLRRELQAALAGPAASINPQELREAIYCYNRPDRLATILAREDSTLSTLIQAADCGSAAVYSLQQSLKRAVNSLAPSESLPPLEILRERAVRAKRRRHLPPSAADYYTLHLAMEGHTQDDIAEMLDVSPRQVRNYLDRAVASVKAFLENEIATPSGNFR